MNMNQNHLCKDRVIDLKELCWRLLEQWRAVIIVVVCVMVAFFGLLIFREMRVSEIESNQQNDKQITESDIINALPESEKTVVASTYRLLQEREKISDYIYNAPIMKLDPNKAERLRVSWAIDESGKDNNALAMSYVMELQTESCRSRMINACGVNMDAGHFNDLVFFSLPEKIGEGVVCCDIFLTAEMQEDILQNELGNIVKDIHTKITNEFGDHQIRNYQSEIAFVADDRILQQQTTLLNGFANLNNQINSFKNVFSIEQKEALGKLQELENEQETAVAISHKKSVFTVRNVIIGIILGGVAYLVCFFLYFMLSGKVIGGSMVDGIPGRVMGEWACFSTDSKRNLLMLDSRFFNKHHKNHLNKNEEIYKASRSIKSLCDYKRVYKLAFVLTTELTRDQQSFVDELKKSLETKGINITVTKENNYQIEECDIVNNESVMFIVVDSKTSIKSIEMIIEQCNDYERLILGSIVLAGY